MVAFKALWDGFPNVDTIKARCFNKQAKSSSPFDNYCAILLSDCFITAGVSLDKCPPGHRCWSHSGTKHVLTAAHLAKWLSEAPPAGFAKREKIDPGSFQSVLAGRTGVIFFKDYWSRNGETSEARSGDHIDLWSKNRITGGSMFYRGIIELLGLVSELNKSREVWFWEVK